MNVEQGGFVATDHEAHYDFLKQFSEDIDFEKLHSKLKNLNSKLKKFDELNGTCFEEQSNDIIFWVLSMVLTVIMVYSPVVLLDYFPPR